MHLTSKGITDGIVLLVAVVGVISFWRGLWNLQDKILPNNPILSNSISIVAGLLLIMLMYVYFPDVFGQ